MNNKLALQQTEMFPKINLLEWAETKILCF